MENITTFLKKFIKLTPPERFIKEIFVKTVEEITNITLKSTDIQIQKSTIYITPHPLIKNELFLQKDAILKKLNQELQQYKKTINDIR